MNDHDLENWFKVKATLESADKTDNHFYRRAIAIIAEKPDPLADAIKLMACFGLKPFEPKKRP